MTDILAIKRMLADRAPEVAAMLLPAGRKEGPEWRVGSTGGEAGKSLGVHLRGSKAGVWSDFSTGESGDLLDLWRSVRGLSLVQALDEARSWLGVEIPKFERPAKRTYVRPTKPQCRAPQGRVMDYLREVRNLSAAAIEAYKIAESGEDIIFPFLLPDGVLAMAKKRRAEDGAEIKPTAADCEPVLFGWQAIPADAREVVIVEGEIDAPSMWDYGFPALSVPYGGGPGAKQQWIEHEFDRMARFERIYIATDMDKPGEQAAEEIANRLGRHRCLRVKLPRKDANDCLKDGISRDEMLRIVRSAESLDPAGLRRASDFRGNVVSLFWPADDVHQGYSTPYGKLGNKLLFRPAEVTIWTGATGSGKSQILSDCIVEWVKQGSRVCLSSLEMKPAQTLKRMCKQVTGVERPTELGIGASLCWLDRGLLLYEFVGKAGVEQLLAVFDYARAKYGCDQFGIDSMMRLGIASDDYVGQEKAVFRIVDWTIANNVHTHLVAHSRKGERDRNAPETEDIKGAMEIGANAFNVLTVWRNRDLEDRIKKAESDEEKAHLAEKPGVLLNVAKQRNGDFEGKVGLWFDQDTYRYRSSHEVGAFPRTYLRPEDLHPEESAA